VKLVNGIPITAPLKEERHFGLFTYDVTSLITGRSRVIVVNSPNSPTGGVLSHDETSSLAKIAVARDMLVISEVYEKIVCDGAKHHCLAALHGMPERKLAVNSFSKTLR
jgi:aspartate/methionine/tyrosine aminotransferase